MGLGMHMEFDVDLVIPNKDVPFEDGAIAAMSSNPKSYFLCQFAEVLKSRGFSLKNTWNDLPKRCRKSCWKESLMSTLPFFMKTLWERSIPIRPL